ncbi:hypothetical protein QL285_014129 [Trifolium repens]|nr:hypothetical protein QL285_014129 [Trifolium repens]
MFACSGICINWVGFLTWIEKEEHGGREELPEMATRASCSFAGEVFFCLLAKRASNILGQFLFLLFEFKNKTQMTKEEGNSNV